MGHRDGAGQGHTMAERSGDATSNFIAWVNSCV